jgi:hypothetical protein
MKKTRGLVSSTGLCCRISGARHGCRASCASALLRNRIDHPGSATACQEVKASYSWAQHSARGSDAVRRSEEAPTPGRAIVRRCGCRRIASARFGVQCEYDAPEEAFMLVELAPGYMRRVTGTVQFHPAFRDV